MAQYHVEEISLEEAYEVDKPVKHKWNLDWLDREIYGVRVREFVRKLTKPGIAFCLWCEAELMYGGTGFAAFSLHCATERHKTVQKTLRPETNFLMNPRPSISRKKTPAADAILGRPRSVSWLYFERRNEDKTKAWCKVCNAMIECGEATTGPLFHHLKAEHPIQYKEAEAKRMEEMDEYLKQDATLNSLGAMDSNGSMESGSRRGKPSYIWHYFERLDKGNAGKCKMCGKECINLNKSTSRLIQHFRNKHREAYKEFLKHKASQDSHDDDDDSEDRDAVASILRKGSAAPFPRENKKRSLVWRHFKVSPGGTHVVCLHCGSQLTKGSTTTNMMKHCKVHHPHEWEVSEAERAAEEFEESTDENMDQSVSFSNISKEEGLAVRVSRPHLRKSLAWKHFTHPAPDAPYVQCNHCNKRMIKLSNTSNMLNHTKKMHWEEWKATEGLAAEEIESGAIMNMIEEESLAIKMRRPHARKSLVWKHFVHPSREAKYVQCLHCHKKMTKLSNTSNMLNHAKKMHWEQWKASAQQEIEEEESGEAANFTQERKKPSLVWKHYQIPGPDATYVVCMYCDKELTKANSTTNLRQHMIMQHPDEWKATEAQEAEESRRESTERPGRGRPRLNRPGVPDSKQLVKRAIKNINISKSRKWDVDQALMTMLVWDLEPTSLLKRRGFRKFVSMLNPNYELPKKSTVTSTLLPQLMEETKNVVKFDLKQSSHVALTLESWIYKGTQPFLTVSAHFMSPSWRMTNMVLDTFDFSADRTVTGLATNLKRITDAWNISDKVVAVLSSQRDENVSSACVVNGWDDLLCFGNTLNKIVTEALASVTKIVDIQKKASEAVSFFDLNVKASETLSAVQQEHNISEHRLKQLKPLQRQPQPQQQQQQPLDQDGGPPVKPCDEQASQQSFTVEHQTSWLSIYSMFRRMVEQYEAVNTVLCYLGSDHMCICDDDIEIMKGVMKVLKPFHVATTELCAEPFTCLSKIIPVSTLLQRVTTSRLPTVTKSTTATPSRDAGVDAATGDDRDGSSSKEGDDTSGTNLLQQVLSDLRDALAFQLQNHLASVESNCKVAMATLLDPRFKQHAFQDTVALESAKQRLLTDLGAVLGVSEEEEGGGADSNGRQEKDMELGDDMEESFWDIFDKKVEDAGASRTASTEAENELSRFFKEANIPRSKDPLEWWNLNKVQYPHLKILAQKYLCVPATALDSSRIFTKQAAEFAKRRDCFHPDQIHSMLFLNTNLK